MKRWSQLLAWLRRRMPHLQYACAKEVGPKTGMKHLHVAAFNWTYLPQAALSDQWAKYTGAPVVDVRRVEAPAVARYIAKHFAKTVPVTRKAMSFSKHWPRRPRQMPLVRVEFSWSPPLHDEPLAVAADGSILHFRAPGCHCFDHIFGDITKRPTMRRPP